MCFHISDHPAHQVLRFTAAGGDEDAVAGMNIAKNIIGWNELFRFFLLPLF